MNSVPIPEARTGDVTERWLAALDALFTVPGEYRNDEIERAEALSVLRCGEAVLEELVRAGLPCSGEPGAERFDRFDLMNLSYGAGLGTSLPERAIRFALRWMAAGPDTLFEQRAWDFRIAVTCGEVGGCGEGATWAMARPCPEIYGGRVDQWHTDPSGVHAGHDRFTANGTPSMAVSAVLTTAGDPGELRSPLLREIVSAYTGPGYRWVRLPEQVQQDPAPLLAKGLAPCIAVSLDLAERCRAAGYPVRTRRGWIMGMLDMAHSWLEVVDDDGLVKTIDPTFAKLADDHAEDPHPALRELCFGSRLNRLLPTEYDAGRPLFDHECDGRPRRPRVKTTIRTARV